jgi:hypothetical protein
MGLDYSRDRFGYPRACGEGDKRKYCLQCEIMLTTCPAWSSMPSDEEVA